MTNQTIDTTRSVTIEIDPEKIQKIGWVDSNKIEFVFLPLDEEVPYGNIAKVIFRDQKIFIKPFGIDRIYIYTNHGETYGIINFYGEGPGEYLALTDFDVNTNKKQIVVSDAGNRKFLTYTYNGELLAEKPMNYSIKMVKSFLAKNEIHYIVDLRYSNILPGQTEVFNINLFDENWDFIKGYFPFSHLRGAMFGNPYMLFSRSDTCTGYYKTFTDSIFHFENDEMFLAYKLDFPKPVLTYEDMSNSQYGLNIDDQIYSITYDESTSYVFIGFMNEGAIHRLLYDKINSKIKYFTFFNKDGSCSQRIFSYTLGLHGSKLILQASALNVDCIVDVFRNSLTDEQILALNKVREVDNNFLVLIQL